MAEAGMVGGLADWFAVTALFRRPLGLPIPHTALVPENQDRIAEGIAAYIDREFMEPEQLSLQTRRLDLGRRLGVALARRETQSRLTAFVLPMLARALDPASPSAAGREGDVRSALLQAMGEGLGRMDWRPTLAQGLRRLLASNAAEPLIEEIADRLIHFVHSRRGWLHERMAETSRWWMPSALDQSLANQVSEAILGHLYDLRTPHSPAGADLRRWLATLPDEIAQGGPLGQRLMAALEALIGPRHLGPLLAQALTALHEAVAHDTTRPDGNIARALSGIWSALAQQLTEPETRHATNAAAERILHRLLPQWRQAIRHFIVETVRSQDARAFSDKLERAVGRDLQYIRINGVILGALIGGALHILNLWLA
jgi:uncharacterized membrane-anchored protein YjiN (DUF445 family)